MSMMTGIWDKVRPWKKHGLVQPVSQSIQEFYDNPNCGIHDVNDVIPAIAWQPIHPKGPPAIGHEPQQFPENFDRNAHGDLVAIGPAFFADDQRNTLKHI